MSTASKPTLPLPLTGLPPIYDVDKTYEDNRVHGPFFDGWLPTQEVRPPTTEVLGIPLSSPIGIPAGPLLDSKWVALAAQLRYDLVAYKTIRSFPHPAHQLPNVAFVDQQQPLMPGALPPAVALGTLPQQMDSLTITNSFGNPTQELDFLREDIPRAKAALQPGQALIVSVVGTPGHGASFAEDFADAARFATECGADVVEANFSCPNVDTADGTLYRDPQAIEQFCKTITKATGDTPLVIKMGALLELPLLRQALQALVRGGARGVCGINTVGMAVQDSAGNPSLGPDRPTSGICGAAIRDAALAWTAAARKIIEEDNLDLDILACGGIVLPHHFQEFLDAGADVAMTATGMMWDPYLAYRYQQTRS